MIWTSDSRSAQMARIRGRNTSPEVLLRRALWARGLRYRLHARTPVGRPDLVFAARHVAVFIDGCFWHGCPDHYVRPNSRTDFWSAKLAENTARDRAQTEALERIGWRVVRLWEHSVFTELEAGTDHVAAALTASDWTPPDRWVAVRVTEVDPATRLEQRELVELRGRSPPRVDIRVRSTAKWKRPP